MSTRPLPGDTSYVETGIRDELILRYFSVAALAVAVYEYLITIGEEVEFIWPSRFSIPKALFFVNRYLPIVAAVLTTYMNITDTKLDDCRPIMVISSVLLLSCCYCAEVTLSLRVYAVWGLNRIVLIILVIVIMCSAGGGYYMVVTFALSGSTSPFHLIQSGCVFPHLDTNDWLLYLVLVIEATVVFGLLLVKAISYYWESGSFGTLLKTMLTGGATYFLCIISMAFANLVMLLFKQAPLNRILINLQGVLCGALSNHLLLQIRQVAHAQANVAVSVQVEGMNFRSNPALGGSTAVNDRSIRVAGDNAGQQHRSHTTGRN